MPFSLAQVGRGQHLPSSNLRGDINEIVSEDDSTSSIEETTDIVKSYLKEVGDNGIAPTFYEVS